MTFGERTTTNSVCKLTRKWYLKSVKIIEKRSWEHVRILLSGNFSSTEQTKAAANKGKAYVGALMQAKVRPAGLNPIIAANVWRSYGLPAMLYGSEVLWNLTQTEEEILNRANAFAAKRIQGFCITASSHGALGAIGMWQTTAYIDKEKRLFLGSFCRSPPDTLQKHLFLYRVFSHFHKDNSRSIGFAGDVYKILETYNLMDYLTNYLATGEFPNKTNWKEMVKEQIYRKQMEVWKETISAKPNLKHLQKKSHKFKAASTLECNKAHSRCARDNS